MHFKMSKLAWGLLIALLILSALITSGRVTGILPDIARITAAVATIAVVIRDWWTYRHDENQS